MVELPKKNDGGPAFPTGDNPDSKLYAEYGMSLRDYFAAKVLNAHAMYEANGYSMRRADHRQMLAEDCYAMADGMLAERAK